MCLVTFFAVGGGLLSKVSFVARGTFRNFAVSVIMAEAAGQGGMLALVVAQLYYLAGMTGYAGISYVVGKCNVERSVRIFMAACARCQLVM